VKKFWSKHKAEIGWITGLVVIVLLGFWWIPGDRGTTDDTLSTSSNGKKAFYLATQRLMGDVYPVQRSTENLIPPDDADTLVIIGPARYPDSSEWQELYEWVRGGRTLIFAAQHGDAAIGTNPFGFTVVPIGLEEEDEALTAPPAKKKKKKAKDDEEEFSFFQERKAKTELIDGVARWRSNAWIESPDSGTTVLIEQDEKAQAIAREIGNGVVVVTSSDYVFCNRALMDAQHRQLAWRLFEHGAPAGPIYFDETLNAAGSPKVFGILFNTQLRPFTLQLLLVTVLFGWWGSRRFGPIEEHEDSTRRNIREHATALGQMHYRVKAGPHALKQYYDRFKGDMRLTTTRPEAHAAVLASRSGMRESKVADLLNRVNFAMNYHGQLPNTEAANLMKSLVELRAKVEKAAHVDKRADTATKKTKQ